MCRNVTNPNIFTTPDYLNFFCQKKKVDYRPYILFDTSPHSGNAYIGLVSRTELAYSYQEYALLEFDSLLIGGRKYELNFYVKLLNQKYFQNVFDILFTEKRKFNTRLVKGYAIIDEPNVTSICKQGGYIDTLHWEKVTAQYVAKGNEKYLLVGLNYGTLLKTNYSSKKKYIFNSDSKDNICYYYFDDFELKLID